MADDDILRVDLRGRDIRPGAVSSREIAEVITAVEDMLVAIALRDDPESRAEDLIVGLSSIEEGSVRLGFGTPRVAPIVAAFGLVTAAIATGDFRSMPNRSIESLKVLSTFSKRHDGEVQLGSDDNAVPTAVVTPALILPQRSVVRGTTTLHGRIIRVGGRRPRVMIETLGGSTVYADASPSVAKDLAGRLYEYSAMEGLAVWNPDDWSLDEFRIESAMAFRTQGYEETLSALSLAVGSYFADIDDVPAWVAALRAEA